MLRVSSCRGADGDVEVDLNGSDLPMGALWIDLLDPTEAEIAFLRRAAHLDLPSRAQLSEVESTSRLRNIDDTLYLSLPVVYRLPSGEPRAAPVGLILSKDRLVTVRFDELKSFDSFRERVDRGEITRLSTAGIFVALLEAIVDRLADVLEEVGADLDATADRVFADAPDRSTTTARQKKAEDHQLRATLKRVGTRRQLVSKVRATLLGIARIVPYVEAEGAEWLPPEAKARLDAVKADVTSLDEYEVHLSDKVQFVLDASLGLISIEQNDTFKVLTVASVVGIPPTLIASMYGMNFKNMPELDWHYGYAWGLFLIAASAILPALFFKVKGWF
jgi:magnesium transporter